MRTVFLRVLEAADKATALLDAIRESGQARGRQRFNVDPKSFASVPRSPFAYWVSDRLRRLFKELPPFEATGRTAKQGLASGDDARFLRVWWEVPDRDESGWVPLVKGGAPNVYFSDPLSSVKWLRDGVELKAFASAYRASRGWGDQWSAMINATEYYFLPGITWPLRSSRFAPAAIPRGCAFSTRGCAALADIQELPSLLTILSSQCFDFVFKMLLGRFGHPEFTSGALQQMPIPELDSDERRAFDDLFLRGWSLKRSLSTSCETSHAYVLPSLVQVTGDSVAVRALGWREHVRTVEAELADVQAEIDDRCFALYGIDEADRRAINEGFDAADYEEGSNTGGNEADDDADTGEDADDNESTTDATGLAAELLSWTVGVAFGRFDLRLATGARALPSEPEPFDPLPISSAGMLTGDDSLPLSRPPAGYPLAFPEVGVLVDDPGHAWDLTAATRTVFGVVFGTDADRWWEDLAALLVPKDRELRGWLADRFFEFHLKRYSKSRRKAPIFWQLGLPSGHYSVWLHAHRLSRDSFLQIQTDVVVPKLAHEERQLTNLMQSAGDSPSVSERKAIAAQETLVEELRAMLEEIKRVAPLWNPNLDDGVVLTMAPLWRLIPRHKPWQKELKSKWDELAGGAYDWANLAMHLWPERVVPRCTTDRSIAIAHGLEDLFWLEDLNNQWRAVQEPAQEREYVASYWAGSPRTKLLEQARDLWAERYFNAGRIDSDWWHELEMGEHDDHPLAIRLWPRRVCETALVDPVIAKSHELNLPKLSALSAEETQPRIEAWLDKMSRRHGAAEIDRSFMSAAFGEREPLREWKAWWAQLDDGQLDHLPVARYFRPEEVAKACQSTLDLANVHEVRRFFFIDTGSSLRKRLPPTEEISREVAERTSQVVKAALKSLVEAPGTVTRKKSARSRSRR
jgi:hypothetical protein